MSTPIISFIDVKKSFESTTVLNGLNLDIHKGESVVLLGASGTGKSVTLKCFLGLLPFEGGDILIQEQSLRAMNTTDRRNFFQRVGMLFQGGALFDSFVVWKNIAFRLLNQGTKKREAYRIAVEKLEQVGLDESVGHLYPMEISGGMKKRVALARAIATNPDILLCDEPTTGLDPIMANVINSLITSCVKQLGATAITITHDMLSCRTIAQTVAVLDKGQVIWKGDISELDNAQDPYVQRFLKASQGISLTAKNISPGPSH